MLFHVSVVLSYFIVDLYPIIGISHNSLIHSSVGGHYSV